MARIQEEARTAQEPSRLVKFWLDHWKWIIGTMLTIIGLYIAGVSAGVF